MSYNVQYVKDQIQRVLKTAPTIVSTYRTTYKEDGYGGRYKVNDKQVVHENLKVIFDNSGSPNLTRSISEAGIKYNETPIRLFIPFEPEISMEINDLVVVQNSRKKYVITQVNNILEQNLLYEVKLEMRD